ncbi:MAG: MFS transporter [Verrucomicrobia bacterium]|nr:MFS transporter [Verrucomicrobiota bacterium]
MSQGRHLSSFVFLNITQFLGALNDNLFKMALIFMLLGVLGTVESASVLAISGGVFVLPFLLFSIPSGTLADRFSKRNIALFTKVLELCAMLLAVWAFSVKSVWGGYSVLFLMGFQSAIFGPSKYGMVPELVQRHQIARANGILTGLTVLATIVGTFCGSYLTDLTDRNFPLVAWIAVGIAVAGLSACCCIERTPAMGVKRNLTMRMVTGLVKVLARARKENCLVIALIGSAYFFLIGAFMQLSVIPFGMQSLGLTDVDGGYLFLTASVGIAFGAFTAGRLSGQKVELGISIFAGLGMVLCSFLLYLGQHSLVTSVTALILLGFSGGLFLVPFDAYIQAASADEERGENVSAGSFLSFAGVAISAFLVYFFEQLLDLTAAESFAWMAIVTLGLTIFFAFRLSDTLVRLLGRVKFRAKNRMAIEGEGLLSHKTPSLFLTLAPHWKIALLTMIALQLRYTRILMERPTAPLSCAGRWLCRFAKVVFYEGAAPQEGSKAHQFGKHALDRGYSLTLIPASERSDLKELEKFAISIGNGDAPYYAQVLENQLKITPLTR